MNPRKLTLVRVRDVEEPDFNVSDFTDAPGHFDNFCEIASGGRVFRISGSAAHQEFWRVATRAQVPDLIIVDINFERDLTSPLREKFIKIPTGLLHALPFLTWSRVGGALSVVVFNTHDPNVFKLEADPTMRLLAAELGVIAMAVAGDLLRLVSPNRLSDVYDWLANKTAKNEDAALLRAVSLYRHRLLESSQVLRTNDPSKQPTVVISPVSYGNLVSLAEQAACQPKEARIDVSSWPGLDLIYADGRRDSISISSLFGEVPALIGQDFLTAPGFGDPAELNGTCRPSVGAFIQSLSCWRTLYEEAVRVESHLPCRDERLESGNFNALAPASAGAPYRYVRILTIAFHLVRQAHLEWLDWNIAYRSEWELETTNRQPVFSHAITIQNAYKAIFQLLKRLAAEMVEPIPEDDLLSAIRDDNWLECVRPEAVETLSTCPKWLRLACEALESLGLIERTQPDGKKAYKVVAKSFSEATPEAGRAVSIRWVSQEALMANMGFNSHKSLYETCKLPGISEDRSFVSELLEGRCPFGWIREVAREFAQDVLNWHETRLWPDFLRDTSRDGIADVVAAGASAIL